MRYPFHTWEREAGEYFQISTKLIFEGFNNI